MALSFAADRLSNWWKAPSTYVNNTRLLTKDTGIMYGWNEGRDGEWMG